VVFVHDGPYQVGCTVIANRCSSSSVEEVAGVAKDHWDLLRNSEKIEDAMRTVDVSEDPLKTYCQPDDVRDKYLEGTP